jgi:protein-tyrosine-phosphatase
VIQVFRVLFVCTGNTCRSPMAEVLFRELVQKEKRENEIISVSAGVAAWEDVPASWQALEAMKQFGIDMAEHRARLLTPELVDTADLVLTMTESHKKAVLALLSEGKEKVHTIREFADCEYGDVADPYGASVEVYQKCADELSKYLLKSWHKILKFTKSNEGEITSA